MNELDSFKKILRNHEERISKLENIAIKKPSALKKNKNKTTITDLFIELKKDGFFNEPRFRDDIVKKLEELGHIYSGDSLNKPLIKSVKSRILGRKRIKGNWGYVKR